MSSRAELVIRSWRIQEAEPHGLTMWFDPRCEEPALRSAPPPISEESLKFEVELEDVGTKSEEEGVPLEGGDTRTSAQKDSELPF